MLSKKTLLKYNELINAGCIDLIDDGGCSKMNNFKQLNTTQQDNMLSNNIIVECYEPNAKQLKRGNLLTIVIDFEVLYEVMLDVGCSGEDVAYIANLAESDDDTKIAKSYKSEQLGNILNSCEEWLRG